MSNRAMSQGLIDLGERIRKRRQEIHMSQEAFAEKAGISVNTVSRVEGGQTAMSIEIFKRMVETLDADANELLGERASVDEQSRMRNTFLRVRHLKKKDQELILRTLSVLLDGLQSRE